MRKPHIFISSRLRLGKAREQIKQLLEESGLSAEIYEKDSTPSTEPATYLRDIIEADFVIFVLDDTYGTRRTRSGLSGVHEEWNRVRLNRIPNHVYLKRSAGITPDRKQKQFIASELVSNEISYYYYSSTNELLSQVRHSLVKMVLDIARSRAYRARLDAGVLMADVVARDHETLCAWDRALLTLFEYEQDMPEYVTDAWGHFADMFTPFNVEKIGPFLDYKAQELFGELVGLVQELSLYVANQTLPPGKPGGTLSYPIAPCEITIYLPRPPLPHDFFEQRDALKQAVRQKWEEISSLIRRRYTRYAQS